MDKAVQGRTAHGWNGRGAKPEGSPGGANAGREQRTHE
jgi:hypothetical protein